MDSLTKIQRDLLYTIGSEAPVCGSTLQSRLEDYHHCEITGPAVYTNLKRLRERGFVATTEIDGRTNGYSITEAGVQFLRERREWETRYVPNTRALVECLE